MKCLATRLTSEGHKRRRYQRDDGTRMSTIEIPLALYKAFDRQGRRKNRAEQWLRAQGRETLRGRARMLVLEGWRTIAIASELKVPVRTVQRWVAR